VSRYLLPQLLRSSGYEVQRETAVLSREHQFKPALSLFLPVSLSAGPGGEIMAEPVITNGSGDYCGLAPSDGFIELSPDATSFPAGTLAPLYRW